MINNYLEIITNSVNLEKARTLVAETPVKLAPTLLNPLQTCTNILQLFCNTLLEILQLHTFIAINGLL